MLSRMCVAHSPDKMCETAGSDVCQAARRLMKAFPVKSVWEVDVVKHNMMWFTITTLGSAF